MRRFLPLLLVAFAGSAWAQSGELWFDAGASLLSNNNIGTTDALAGKPNDYSLTDGFRFGFRFAFNTQKYFGHEVQYQYSRTQLRYNPSATEQGMAIHTGGYNFLAYARPQDQRIRPFATAGVQFMNFVPPGSSATSGGGNTKFGINYGGGVKVKITSMFALRFDVRQYASPKPFSLLQQNGWLKQNEVSAGFGVYF